ncbi:hypothetical protein [Hymenobacter wooponensis]|uniref:Uncharacterized protein n=1 Tax=Hymenobacter wooponensis TaxID=1525360 RepID=A0A4Z0MAN6_9BACT|nr:hypothetical protein [Hymenobacter wooponensis]TGD76792.1 hypothetical protein EU557_25130 [Hymenobacter wooponensis]
MKGRQTKPSWLTVQAHSWIYSREGVPDWGWTYTRRGDTLLFKWAQREDTAVIMKLSANQLSYRLNLSAEGDAQDYSVNEYHYSR